MWLTIISIHYVQMYKEHIVLHVDVPFIWQWQIMWCRHQFTINTVYTYASPCALKQGNKYENKVHILCTMQGWSRTFENIWGRICEKSRSHAKKLSQILRGAHQLCPCLIRDCNVHVSVYNYMCVYMYFLKNVTSLACNVHIYHQYAWPIHLLYLQCECAYMLFFSKCTCSTRNEIVEYLKNP